MVSTSGLAPGERLSALSGSWSRSMDTGFADVYAMHHARALRTAYLLCGDRHRAEDIVADAFVKIYRRWRRGGIDDPGAYVRRAVINQTNSRFRRLALEGRHSRTKSGDLRGERAPDDHLADQQLLIAALRRLPDRQRTALVLRYYDDLSVADTAAAMGVSVGTVKSTVARGLVSLRRAMEDSQPEVTR